MKKNRSNDAVVQYYKKIYVRCAWHIYKSSEAPIVERDSGRMVGSQLARNLNKILPENVGICEPCAERLRKDFTNKQPFFERSMEATKYAKD